MRFRDALAAPGLGAIAEFKRRSPSMGDIRPGARIDDILPRYAANGASAISVLVDERFAGSVDDLRAARAAVATPLLAKGFFTTDEHLTELKDAGADAALLILRDLDDETARRLLAHAERIGLDTLVEAHDRDELARAVALHAPVVGVNARDLSTFAIDRRSQLDIVADAARLDNTIVVAESAVHSRAQAAAAELAGADAVLVGTALMQAAEPGAKLRSLLSRPLVKVCGLTRQEDVDAAVDAGADLLGFIFVERSPRKAEAVLEVPETALSVAVYVGERGDADADLTQLYPDDGGTVRGRRALVLRGEDQVATLLDQPWDGTDPQHWQRARDAEGRIVLAGGLGPGNVRAAIEAVRPWAVDAASSLESAPGIKDHDKVRAYVEAAHA